MTYSISETNCSASTLLCKRDVPLACRTIPLFLRASSWQYPVYVYSDGSIDQQSIEQLQIACGKDNIKILLPAEQEVLDLLSGYPLCQKYRQTDIYSIKLFDIPLLSRSRWSFYFDSDIIFVGQIANLFDSHSSTAIFMKDLHSYISISMSKLLLNRLKVGSHLNAGMYFLRPSIVLDLDYIEYLLAQSLLYGLPGIVEQTIWAMLAAKTESLLWSSQDVAVVRPKLGSKAWHGLSVAHFSGISKRFINQSIDLIQEDPIFLATRKLDCVPLSLINVFEAITFTCRRRLSILEHNHVT